MDTIIRGEHLGVTQWLERRRALGQDLYDEVWEGVYYVAPNEHTRNSMIAMSISRALQAPAELANLIAIGPFNLGTDAGNYRVPDGGWVRGGAAVELYMPTAAAVLEVVSPNDRTYEKFAFYAASGVQELFVALPASQHIECWSLQPNGTYELQAHSQVFDMPMQDLPELVRWP